MESSIKKTWAPRRLRCSKTWSSTIRIRLGSARMMEKTELSGGRLSREPPKLPSGARHNGMERELKEGEDQPSSFSYEAAQSTAFYLGASSPAANRRGPTRTKKRWLPRRMPQTGSWI